MDLGDIMEGLLVLVLVATAAFVAGGAGWRLARALECHFTEHRGFSPEARARLLLLEDECATLRRELTEVKDRQDFMDSLFLQRRPDTRLAPPLS
ncbi:MAG TPA: hypothetical protein VH680_01925 [Gemmatimonadales bacterium]|jgi:hypothetical protein